MNITSGKIIRPQKVCIYGPEGIGKSSLAAQFPDPLFCDTEGGTHQLDVKRLDKPTSWNMLTSQIAFVKSNPSSCSTFVLDTADWAEQLCSDFVIARASNPKITGIEDFGYGKGLIYMAEETGRLLNALSELLEVGINVVLVAHAVMRKFEQPDEAAAYDRWELKLSKKIASLVKEWADAILFVNYKTIVESVDAGMGKTKGKARGGQRVVYTTHHACWDAKNRWGLPDEFPLDFAAIAPHIPYRSVTKPEPAQITPAAAPVPTPVQQPAAPVVPAPPPQQPTPNTVQAPAVMPKQTIVFAQDGSIVSQTTTPDHLKPLLDLMVQDGITDEQVRGAIAAKGWKTKETPMVNYEPDLCAYLVSDWIKLVSFIKDLEVPFK